MFSQKYMLWSLSCETLVMYIILHGKLVLFTIVSHFNWLVQIHLLTTESLRSGSVLLYSISPFTISDKSILWR
jgi:hypothetical protein